MIVLFHNNLLPLEFQYMPFMVRGGEKYASSFWMMNLLVHRIQVLPQPLPLTETMLSSFSSCGFYSKKRLWFVFDGHEPVTLGVCFCTTSHPFTTILSYPPLPLTLCGASFLLENYWSRVWLWNLRILNPVTRMVGEPSGTPFLQINMHMNFNGKDLSFSSTDGPNRI